MIIPLRNLWQGPAATPPAEVERQGEAMIAFIVARAQELYPQALDVTLRKVAVARHAEGVTYLAEGHVLLPETLPAPMPTCPHCGDLLWCPCQGANGT